MSNLVVMDRSCGVVVDSDLRLVLALFACIEMEVELP
jgi:hypothetical protein